MAVDVSCVLSVPSDINKIGANPPSVLSGSLERVQGFPQMPIASSGGSMSGSSFHGTKSVSEFRCALLPILFNQTLNSVQFCDVY